MIRERVDRMGREAQNALAVAVAVEIDDGFAAQFFRMFLGVPYA